MWTVVAASVPGSAHPDLGNRDAVGYLPDSGTGPSIRVAVADGHGDPAYARSGRGAALAIRAALAEPLVAASDTSLEGLMRASVVHWREAVDADLADEPHAMGRDAYATTLVVVSADADVVACAQIGDGRILAVTEAGSVTSPMPEDPRPASAIVANLAGPDPMGTARFSRFPARGIRLLLMCTDGYADSFPGDEALFGAAADFADIADEHGVGVIRSELRGWLHETMQRGSGDDTTVAVVARVESDTS